MERRFLINDLNGLKDLPPIPKSQPNTTSPENEAKVIEESLAHPSWACVKLSDQIKLKGLSISSPTIQKILDPQRNGSVSNRLLKVEEKHLDEGFE